jgi:hypothetical protein
MVCRNWCCWVPCTPMFFLVLRGLVKRSLWDPLLRALQLPFGCTILCGLVPTCGSAVVRRSSRSLHSFSASLPVAWSHPTFVRYKAFTRCLQQVFLLRNLLLWRPGHSQEHSFNGLYHVVIRAIIVTIDFGYYPPSHPLSSITYLFVHVLQSTKKARQKKDAIALLWYCFFVCFVHLVASHHRCCSLCFNFFRTPLMLYCVCC